MRTPGAVNAMLCPVCSIGLALGDRGGVEIDYCPLCPGVWLDRGELDKIIERTAGSRTMPTSDRRKVRGHADGGPAGLAAALLCGDDDHYERRRRDDRYNRKRHKSILSDFFD